MARLFDIRRDVSPRTRWVLGFVSWGSLIGIWFCLTHWSILPAFTLPPPMGVVKALGRLWSENNLLGNVFMSWWRIAQAFFWCVVIAIPLGLMMGSFRWLNELVNP